MSNWKPYSPTKKFPWTLERAAHLHRRSIFGATWKELKRDAAGNPQDAVSPVLAGESRIDGVPEEFDRLSDLISRTACEQPNVERLKAAWIYRVLYSPDPLRERLTLMWHSHFATSNLKVDNLVLMKQQNDIFRENATAQFAEMLGAVMRDPAMLIWLDAPSNRAGHANENLGRELMELFTLGIGNYSEDDVKNAARALTGLTVRENEYHFDERRHDTSKKTVLGMTEALDPEQLCQILLTNPATASRLAGKLISEFFGEKVVDEAAHRELAEQLCASQLDIGKAVETVLRSELFFSDANINTRICDPLTFLISPLRALELFDDPLSTLALSDWLRRFGLDLYYPPNVAGWPGGRTWLTTRTVISRANYASAVLSGEVSRPATVPKLATIKKQGFEKRMRLLLTGGTRIAEAPNSSVAKLKNNSPEARFVLNLLTSPRAQLH